VVRVDDLESVAPMIFSYIGAFLAWLRCDDVADDRRKILRELRLQRAMMAILYALFALLAMATAHLLGWM